MSRRRLALRARSSGPWHLKHRSESSGLTWKLKSMTSGTPAAVIDTGRRHATPTSAMAVPTRMIAMPTRKARTCRLYGALLVAHGSPGRTGSRVHRFTVHRFTGSGSQVQRAERPQQDQSRDTGRREEDRQGRSGQMHLFGRAFQPGSCRQFGANQRQRGRLVAAGPHVPSAPLATHLEDEPAVLRPCVGDVVPPRRANGATGCSRETPVTSWCNTVRDIATTTHARPTTPIACSVTAEPSDTNSRARSGSAPGSTRLPTRHSITNSPTSTTATPSDARRTPRRNAGDACSVIVIQTCYFR